MTKRERRFLGKLKKKTILQLKRLQKGSYRFSSSRMSRTAKRLYSRIAGNEVNTIASYGG